MAKLSASISLRKSFCPDRTLIETNSARLRFPVPVKACRKGLLWSMPEAFLEIKIHVVCNVFFRFRIYIKKIV
ncbi:MAG: hypothetical protein LBG77_02695 [Dysgonamonadaceae bacterium]|nr:hypothetical protein [Dysgonamonadaceae bacterium]